MKCCFYHCFDLIFDFLAHFFLKKTLFTQVKNYVKFILNKKLNLFYVINMIY